MNSKLIVALSVLGGIAIGVASSEGLRAQAKPPAYVIAEIDVTNADAYTAEYAPLAKKILTEGGGTYLVRGGKSASLDGEPPKNRIAIIAFDSFDKAQAVYTSQVYRDARKIGEKYAKFRVYVVEGVSP